MQKRHKVRLHFNGFSETYEDFLSEHQKEFVSKMLDVGWNVNHIYLGNLDEPEEEIDSGEVDVDLRRLMFGFKQEDGDCHMMSPCGNYTVRITKEEANFWRFKPSFFLLAHLDITEAEFVGNSIRQGPVEVNLDLLK